MIAKPTPRKRPDLDAALARAAEWEKNATPEQIAAMRQAQRESFARAMQPCEHGDYDWETCPQCLSKYAEGAPPT